MPNNTHPIPINPAIDREELNQDLGLGGRLANQSRLRAMNQDGTFNVDRFGAPK